MVDQLTQMALLGGNLLELAITPTNANDVLGLMNAAHDASQRVEQPIIATAMGPLVPSPELQAKRLIAL